MSRFRLDLVVLFLLLAAPALARSPLLVEAEPSLGEMFHGRGQVPVTVLVSNSGDKAYQVELTCKATGSQGDGIASLSLAPGATRRVEMLGPVYPFYLNELLVEATAPGLETVRDRVPVRSTQETDLIILALSPQQTEFAYLSGYSDTNRQVFVNHPAPMLLPQRWGSYLDVDVLVLYDLPALNLPERTQKAILDWIRAGGTLVAVSSLDPNEYAGSAFQKHLPLGHGRIVQADDLGFLSGEVRGQVQLRHLEQPVLLSAELGRGLLLQVTTPITRTDLMGLDLTEALWRVVFELRQSIPADSIDNLELLANPPEIPRPDVGALAWFLFIYAMLVGPVNFGLLRRRDRMLLCFVTVPVIAILFSGGAFVYNSLSRGGDLTARQAGVILARSGSPQVLVLDRMMLFSPRRKRYRLVFPEGAQVTQHGARWDGRDSSPVELGPEGQVILPKVPMGMWSMRFFDVRRLTSLQGSIRFTFDGRRLEVENQSGQPLSGCRIVWKEGASTPFDLPLGQHAVEVHPPHVQLHTMVDQETDDRAILLGWLRNWYLGGQPAQEPLLVGFGSGPAVGVELAGLKATHTEHLFVVRP